MSGPHHYFGYINSTDAHTIHIDPNTKLPYYVKHNLKTDNSILSIGKKDIQSNHVKKIYGNWISGR